MSTKSLVIAAIGVATVVAAGAGSFMASRARPAVPAPEAKSAAALQAPVPPAVIGTSVPVEQPAPPAASAPAPPARVETPAVQARPKVDHGSPAASSSTPARRPSSVPAEPAASPSPSPAATAPAASPVTPATPDVFTPLPAPAAPPPPPPPPDPPKPKFEEVTVREDAVIGIRLDNAVNSETAKVEDRVTARVSRDVNVDSRTAIPAGATLEGTVTLVERGGKFKERARLGIRFTTLVLTDNTRLPIQTETIFRDGDSPTSEAASKVGASAVVGAILGAVIGGKKGAVIGGATGAAGGTAAVQAGGRNEASIPAGSPLTVRLTSPLTVMVERQQDR
jgi:hypothetical protein